MRVVHFGRVNVPENVHVASAPETSERGSRLRAGFVAPMAQRLDGLLRRGSGVVAAYLHVDRAVLSLVAQPRRRRPDAPDGSHVVTVPLEMKSPNR